MRNQQTQTRTESLPGSGSVKRRKIKLPRYSKLTTRSVQQLDHFVDAVPPARLSRSLRDLFLLYLHCDDALPDQLPAFSGDLYFLLQFLDALAGEMKGRIEY